MFHGISSLQCTKSKNLLDVAYIRNNVADKLLG